MQETVKSQACLELFGIKENYQHLNDELDTKTELHRNFVQVIL